MKFIGKRINLVFKRSFLTPVKQYVGVIFNEERSPKLTLVAPSLRFVLFICSLKALIKTLISTVRIASKSMHNLSKIYALQSCKIF